MKTLDFHGNSLPGLLRGKGHPLCAEVDEEILSPVRNNQRIMSNRPSVRNQGMNDGIMVGVSGWHRLIAGRKPECTSPARTTLYLISEMKRSTIAAVSIWAIRQRPGRALRRGSSWRATHAKSRGVQEE